MLTGREPGPAPRTPAGTQPQISTFKGQERALRADRIGTPGLLLSVLAATAPLMVVAGVMPTTYAVMGIVGQPLLFVILAVIMALFSVGYAEMSRHVHNAGAFYAYIARGLGGTAGASASFVALVSYSTMQVGAFGIFGYEASALLKEHADVTVSWWWPALAGLVLVGILGALKVDLNAKVLGVLLLAECLLVLIFDFAFIGDPGREGVSFQAFNPDMLSGSGLGTALCFTIAAFVGFEMAPVYAEETSRPQQVVSRVMFTSIGFAAVFYAFSSWAISVATGPSQVVGAAQQAGPGLVFALSDTRLGSAFSNILSVFFVTGIFACMLSFHNVVARYAFAMGREGLLPAAMGRASKSTGAPALGSLLQSTVALIVIVAFAATDRDPVLHLFTWMGNVGALGIILLMAATSLAVVVFFTKRGVARAQASRLTASITAALALTVILVYAVSDFPKLLGADPNSSLRWILPGIILVAAVVGGAYGAVLRSKRPQAHARIGLGNEAFQLDLARSSAEAEKAPRA
ncbi:APC family permease [Wenjunlia tyrosinilytica]|uniref:Amino acid permease n=1 Tax=Wenjunlia tyrosinilytica TaxID=1544741 RepID=A0A917ZK83_9ACTN|nr:APC family permease [Wenjunlia tyrosinilytica]GGO85404.1 amino acid permease [Wenjunlia tyrosinilytica]